MKSPNVYIGDLAHPEKGSFKIGPFGSSLKKDELVDSGIPVLGIEDVLAQNFTPPFRRYITEEKYQQLSQYSVKPGDVLVTTMGTIGRAAVVPQNIGTMIIDSHLFRMRVDQGKVSPLYLCYALNDFEGLKRQIEVKSRGAIMAGLNTTIIRECQIPLPQLPEQKRIVAILAKADKLRQQRSFARKLGDTFLQSVFREMFGDPVTNPMGWEKTAVGAVADIIVPTRDKPRYFRGNIPWVTLPDLNSFFVSDARLRLTHQDAAEVGNRLMPANTVLLSCAGSLGRIAVTTREVYANQQFYGLVTKPDLANRLFLAFSLKGLGERFYYRLAGISTLGFFSKAKALGIQVPLPPLSLQQDFAQIVNKFKRLRAQHREAERQAEHLFQTLLFKALRGELGEASAESPIPQNSEGLQLRLPLETPLSHDLLEKRL